MPMDTWKQHVARIALTTLPKRALSETVGWAAGREWPGWMTRSAIRSFVAKYDIDTTEIDRLPEDYDSVDSFFTRSLKDGERPIDDNPKSLVSPADGVWSQAGRVRDLDLVQIKGKNYSANELLVSEEEAVPFTDGWFFTIYLSPQNYHRVHFPCAGKVSSYRYAAGSLFPVNPMSVGAIDNLFCRNERLIVHLDTAVGPMAVVMVGATCVARITASFDEAAGAFRHGADAHKQYDSPIAVAKGQELGIFHLGSTVVALMPPGSVRLDSLESGTPVRMGQRIGEWI